MRRASLTLFSFLLIIQMNASYHDVVWESMEGCIEQANGDVLKIHNDSWGNAAAVSANQNYTFERNLLEIEYSVDYSKHAIGFIEQYDNAHYTSIDHCYYMDSINGLFILEEGAVIGSYGSLSEGDYLHIQYDYANKLIKYYKNYVVIHTTALANLKSYRVQCSLFNSGSVFHKPKSITLGQFEMHWEELVGCAYDSAGSTIQKTASHGSYTNCHALSSNYVEASEDGVVQFMVNDSRNLILGLIPKTHTGSVGINDIEYAFHFTGNAFRVREKQKTEVTSFGNYVNHRFRIEKTGSQVKYYREKILVHTSTIPALVDMKFAWIAHSNFNKPHVKALEVDFGHERTSYVNLQNGCNASIASALSLELGYANSFEKIELRVSSTIDAKVEYYILDNLTFSLSNLIADFTSKNLDIDARVIKDGIIGDWNYQICPLQILEPLGQIQIVIPESISINDVSIEHPPGIPITYQQLVPSLQYDSNDVAHIRLWFSDSYNQTPLNIKVHKYEGIIEVSLLLEDAEVAYPKTHYELSKEGTQLTFENVQSSFRNISDYDFYLNLNNGILFDCSDMTEGLKAIGISSGYPYSLTISKQSGDVLFSSSNAEDTWMGMAPGTAELAAEGTYWYSLTANNKTISGIFHLKH